MICPYSNSECIHNVDSQCTLLNSPCFVKGSTDVKTACPFYRRLDAFEISDVLLRLVVLYEGGKIGKARFEKAYDALYQIYFETMERS